MKIYLSCPYTSPDAKIIEKRVKQAQQAVDWLNATYFTGSNDENDGVLCPIVHTDIIANSFHIKDKDALTHEQWMRLDKILLSNCNQLFVLQLDGWDNSKGVIEEIAYAKELGMPIEYINPKQIGVANGYYCIQKR